MRTRWTHARSTNQITRTFALVCLIGGGGAPRSVIVEGFALLAVGALRIVLATTHQLLAALARRLDAFARVSVALASEQKNSIS
jgi:hypothetical protein